MPGPGRRYEQAAAPGYLHTPKGTVALVAMASGLVAKGNGDRDTPGVDELRVGSWERAQRGGYETHSAEYPGCQQAGRHRHRVQHNHVFDKPFITIFVEGLPERLTPPEWLRKWAHAEVDAGADIVVMHGAPLLHGIEIYHNRPIFYDLGNFVFNAPPPIWTIQEPMTWESVVPSVEFQGKRLQSIRLRPIVLNFIGEGSA